MESKSRKYLKTFLVPGLALLALIVFAVVISGGKNARGREIGGMIVTLPEGFSCSYSDSRYSVWKYKGTDQKPGTLILDEDIRDDQARNFATAEDVIERCDWFRNRELYVNPHGVRMARGYADYSGTQELRYYVENAGSVFLICMNMDSRFYNPDDCEAAMLETAESIRPKR